MSLEELKENGCICTFLWKIKHFILCTKEGMQFLKSPTFTSAILDNSQWELMLFPNFENNIRLIAKCINEKSLNSGEVEFFIDKIDGTKVIKSIDLKLLTEDVPQYLLYPRDSVFERADIFLPDDTLTVGCRIKVIAPIFQSNLWIAHTEIWTKKFSITFPFSTSGMQQFITAPLITGNNKYPGFKICLHSSFHGVESVEIYMRMTKTSFRYFAAYQLFLRDVNGDVKYFNSNKRWFEANKDGEKWRLKYAFPNQDQGSFYPLKYSIYTLQLNLQLTDGTYSSKLEKGTYPINISEKNLSDCSKLYTLKEKVRSLHTDKRLCDFTIHVDGKEFPVHKTVLGSISPVFCAMFERDMKEKQSSLLYIEDIDADTVKRLIDFAYNEKIENLQWENAVKLLYAADKYDILELKQYCSNVMIPKMAFETVFEALVISDLYRDNNLKKAAKRFIFMNSRQLFKSDEWKVFMESNMKLANEIMHEILIKMRDEYLYSSN